MMVHYIFIRPCYAQDLPSGCAAPTPLEISHDFYQRRSNLNGDPNMIPILKFCFWLVVALMTNILEPTPSPSAPSRRRLRPHKPAPPAALEAEPLPQNP